MVTDTYFLQDGAEASSGDEEEAISGAKWSVPVTSLCSGDYP